MKKSHVVAGLLVLTALTALVASRLLVSERQRVLRVIHRLEGELEDRDAAGVCHLLAEDYRDTNGHDRAALRALLSRGLPQCRSVDVTVSELAVELEGKDAGRAATVEFDARVVARSRTRRELPPWRWKSRVRLRLRKRDGEWRVTEAEYRLPRGLRP